MINYITFKGQKLIPSKIVCIGRNYVEHIRELQNEIPSSIVIFNKPNSSVTNKLFFIADECHFEAEISFLIQNAQICGVGFGLDLTKRETQNILKQKGLPWERAKAFDNSAVFSSFVPINQNDIEFLTLKLFMNNNLVQYASIDLMIHKPLDILNEINSFMTLRDNDIIMTGTPKGVATYNKNDIFKGEIYLKNTLLISSKWVVI